MRDVCGQSVFRDGYRPEQAACADSGVEVMNLADANGTGEQVHSNKGEGPVVSATVLANVEAAHESVVDLVVEPGLEAGRRVRAGSRAEDSGHTHESVEIRDLGRLVDRPRRDGRKRRKVVDEDPERRYPPTIGRGKTVANSSVSAATSCGSHMPAVAAAPPASAAVPRNVRRLMGRAKKWAWPMWL